MPRKVKFVPTPSRLSEILKVLNQEPKPILSKVKGLKITYAYRNDHWGARHFVQNDLPRIRYVNPRMEIEVNKRLKTKEDQWKPELVVELRDGSSKTLDVNNKWSSKIFEELMELGGGPTWERWKQDRTAQGLPVLGDALPMPKTPPKSRAAKAANEAPVDDMPDPFKLGLSRTIPPATSFLNEGKTGAAAILPL